MELAQIAECPGGNSAWEEGDCIVYILILYIDMTFGHCMHLARLRIVGGSVMFAIPREILKSLDLLPNAQVGLYVSEGRLIVEALPRPRYALAELLAACDASAPWTQEDRAWLEAEPAGREDI